MVGVVRTARSNSSSPSPIDEKAPRPPNAWIIYRSDKAHYLSQPRPGRPRLAQAEISKVISTMWANEPEQTRREYDRRAEEAKAAHALRYPGYRFRPIKKEEKRAQREQQRDERQAKRRERRSPRGSPLRASVTVMPFTASVPQYYASVHTPMDLPQLSHPMTSVLPYPLAPFYPSQTRFGPAGPTPPVSAAASPSDPSSSPSPEATCSADQFRDVLDNADLSLAYNNAEPQVQGPPSSADHLLGTITAMQPTFYPSVFDTAAFASGQEWPYSSTTTFSNAGTLTPALTPSPIWQEVDSNQIQQQTALATSQGTPTENISFDLGPYHLQNLDNILSGSDDESLSAFLNPTNDPSIFQLTQLDSSQLLSNPTGEIEVSLGEIAPLDLSLFPPELFNFSDPFLLGLPQTDHTTSQDLFTSIPDLPTNGDPQSAGDPLNLSYNPDEYLDFGTPPSLAETNELPPLGAAPALIPRPYTPPAGAVNSTYRRVAGSWNKEFLKSQTPSPPKSAGLTQA